MELDYQKISRYNQSYQRWLQGVGQAYEYDNNLCCCFAHLLSNSAEQEGFQTYKVCALASAREDSSAKVSAYLPRADDSGFVKTEWDYHMAFAIEVPVYKDSPKTEFLVADPMLFGRQLVSLKQWQNTLACPDYAFIMARKGMPLQGSAHGFWLSSTEPSNPDVYAQKQLENLQQQIAQNPPCRFKPLKSVLSSGASRTTQVLRQVAQR